MSYYHRKNEKSWSETRIFVIAALIVFAFAALYGLAADPPLSEKMEKMDRVIWEAERRAEQSLKGE